MNFFWSYPILQQLFEPVNYGYLYNWYAAAQPQSIQYGYLYNWYTVDDVRNIANTGWHVPIQTEFTTLFNYVSDVSTCAIELKESGTSRWSSESGTNSYGFTWIGSGYRHQTGAPFNSLKSQGIIWSATQTSASTAYYYIADNDLDDSINEVSNFKKFGVSIRLVKDSTSLSHGQTGIYVGNDGRVYKTICIGTQEWLSENLMETKYRDGSSIPEVTDNTTWSGLTTGARCSYNNTETNAVVSTELANTGWHVPTFNEGLTLGSYLGGNSVAGGKLKEIGLIYWSSPNTGATNEAGFNGRGGGYRTSSFYAIKSSLNFWTPDGTAPAIHVLYYNSTSLGLGGYAGENGVSIRLVKDSTTLTNGQTGTYTGNDGKIYRTICIGTQEWLSDNLKETKYQDGSLIPVVTDNTDWSNLTTGARCVYENNESNA